MTANNFEIGLKDLNLPDIFHVGVVVTHKPVPMLNVMEQGREDHQDEDTKAKNLLENYYKNLSLDYKRQNDLSIFLGTESKQKEILDSVERAMVEAEILHNARLRNERALAQANTYFDHMIEQKILEDDTQEFYNRFITFQIRIDCAFSFYLLHFILHFVLSFTPYQFLSFILLDDFS